MKPFKHYKLEAAVFLWNDIDAIIKMIKEASSEEESLYKLMARGLDDVQSRYILSFPLNRFGALEEASADISKCERMLQLIQKIDK